MNTPCSGSADGVEGRGALQRSTPTGGDAEKTRAQKQHGARLGDEDFVDKDVVDVHGTRAHARTDADSHLIHQHAGERIGGRPAARVGDSNVENGPPATIITGALTVLIGP
jgi:uncharacterized Zn-binding protein involved in type VI secretion